MIALRILWESFKPSNSRGSQWTANLSSRGAEPLTTRKAQRVLEEVKKEAGNDPDIVILDLPPWCALEINAIQRASTVIVQKSLKEGFGLTVTEALWKGKPTIAGAVGGIPNQIINKLTGILVHSVEECASQIRHLLTNPEFARTLGANGHEHVKENFLITTESKTLVAVGTIAGQIQVARAPRHPRGNHNYKILLSIGALRIYRVRLRRNHLCERRLSSF